MSALIFSEKNKPLREQCAERIWKALPNGVFLSRKKIREVTRLSQNDLSRGLTFLRYRGVLRIQKLSGGSFEYRKAVL